MGLLDAVIKYWRGRGPEDRHRSCIEAAKRALALATEQHDAEWGLSEAACNLNGTTQELEFSRKNWLARSPHQFVGSYNASAGVWRWAWDDPQFPAASSETARKLQVHGHKHSIPALTTGTLRLTEEQCWELTALAFYLSGANGAYRIQSGSQLLYLTFGTLVVDQTTQDPIT